jgi:aminopeptidase N
MAQPLNQKKGFTRADTLRGTITPERAWWNVQRYDIVVTPDYDSKSIQGLCRIHFTVTKSQEAKRTLQLDLQEPMIIDSVFTGGPDRKKRNALPLRQDGNVWYVEIPTGESKGEIAVYYHGTPRAAKNAPWDGGWIWKKDAQGRPWMSVAVQGLGASAWYPCKDHQSDEPDGGATLTVNVPDTLVAIANGRLIAQASANGKKSYTWEVKNPINNYNIIPYIGKYIHFSDTLMGEKGKLDLGYWVLDYNLEKAKKQFEQVKPMLRAFEHWFGAYPFYEDGYKLIDAPHLGMEHQSAIAYGNQYKNGYLGRDLSGTGQGLKWDFIIVHESGHEWFANNITTKDIADMWVHESFTNYSETLYLDYHYGTAAGNEYLQGLRKNIANDIPIIGSYGVNQEGSGDMYYKGASLIHTIRQIIGNDAKFRQTLRGLNKDFYHQTVTTKQVEDYMATKSGKKLDKIFDQYLRTTQIPLLEIKTDGDKMKFRWTNCIAGFDMPVRLTNGQWIHPTTSEQKLKIEGANFDSVTADPNFYIQVKKID